MLGHIAHAMMHSLNLLQGSDATLFPMLAQVQSIDAAIEHGLELIRKLLQVVAVCLIVYAAWCVQDGRVRDGCLAVVGGLLLALAVPISKVLFGL